MSIDTIVTTMNQHNTHIPHPSAGLSVYAYYTPSSSYLEGREVHLGAAHEAHGHEGVERHHALRLELEDHLLIYMLGDWLVGWVDG